jgi:hypothetical protein
MVVINNWGSAPPERSPGCYNIVPIWGVQAYTPPIAVFARHWVQIETRWKTSHLR